MNGSAVPTAPPPDCFIEAPPPYSTLAPDSSVNPSPFSSPANRSTSSAHHGNTKLCQMDFLPRLIKKKLFGKDQFESFSDLIQRLNQWLGDHNDVSIINIESVTWFDNNYKNIYTDDTTFSKTTVTMFLTGLRIWFLMPMIPRVGDGERKQVIHCITYPHKPSPSSITHLFSNINQALDKKGLPPTNPTPPEIGGADGGADGATGVDPDLRKIPNGHIISVETVEAISVDGCLDTEETHSKYATGDTRYIFMALRIYLLEDETVQGYESIEYQDFIPGRTGRNKENRGYELFTEVADRGARWVVRKGGVRFVNLQTVNVKLKKDIPASERGRYKDHCSTLLQVLRSYYLVPHHPHNHLPTPHHHSQGTRLSIRTFKPKILNMNGVGEKYEDMRMMVERINKWMLLTGAKLKSAETLVVQASSRLGSEATVLHNRNPDNQLGRYIFQVRLYLDGEYTEEPVASALLF